MMPGYLTRLLDMCRIPGIATAFVLALVMAAAPSSTRAAAPPLTLVVLGDSLAAGYGLSKDDAFPTKLNAALNAKGHSVRVINAGVSGDTTAGGRSRLDWALADKPDAVLLELGANDALRGLSTDAAYDNLAAILKVLQDRKIPVLLAGMRAPPNLGDDYGRSFEAVYRRLNDAFDIVFYPFFLDGAAADPALNQDDGIHPNAAGVDVIVGNILPVVEALLARVPVRPAKGGS